MTNIKDLLENTRLRFRERLNNAIVKAYKHVYQNRTSNSPDPDDLWSAAPAELNAPILDDRDIYCREYKTETDPETNETKTVIKRRY